MSLTPTAPRVVPDAPTAVPVRRVREQARDVVALMVFSAVASVTVATGLLLLARLAAAGR